MNSYSFIVGQPLPSPKIEGLHRLVHLQAPVFSCFMCLPGVVPEVIKKIPAVLALGADDMRHLDGWVFFNFKVHAGQPGDKLLEGKLIALLSRASLQLDLHLGNDLFDNLRPELSGLQEDSLNPSFDMHLGIFEGNPATLEHSLKAAYPEGWEVGWMFSGQIENGVVSLCLHVDTGLTLCARAGRKPYFNEEDLRIALTVEQRSRLQAQGKMFYSMHMGKMSVYSDKGKPHVVAPVFLAPPPAVASRIVVAGQAVMAAEHVAPPPIAGLHSSANSGKGGKGADLVPRPPGL